MRPQTKDTEHTKRICGAKLRNKPGRFCQKPPADGRTRCRLHGGETPRGIASPHFRTGYMSSQLPARLMARMEAAMNDENLQSLRKDIAFVSARIDDTLQRLIDDHEAQTLWQKLLLLRDEFNTATSDQQRGQLVMQMFELIALAEKELAVFDEAHKLIDQRADLIKKETERQLKLSQNVTMDQVTVYFRSLTTAVRMHVDQTTLGLIYDEFERINNRSTRLRLSTTLE